MPLSKRINNLHINNTFQVIPCQTVNDMSLKQNEWGPGPPAEYSNKDITYSNSNNIESIQSLTWNNTPQYCPELSASENPYYYNNKLLFDLFVERMQRNGHIFN